ncbi:hypothetical protein GCM10023165_36620 [Variovorax defluvii]|uniref:HTH cro/C1-type domain-containing protein n=1 Tax=Variovorax defluvii TaxID=913761 RepID=A0ABP8I1Z0_9BURK
MKTRPSARHAYVKAEVVTALAHQVKTIRTLRGWTQVQLAKRLGTTQAAVSRLEDPSYGRVTLKTLFDLASVFDTGLQVNFVSLISMLHHTFVPDVSRREVPSFEEEAPFVCFYSSGERPATLPLASNLKAEVINLDLTSQAAMPYTTASFPSSASGRLSLTLNPIGPHA